MPRLLACRLALYFRHHRPTNRWTRAAGACNEGAKRKGQRVINRAAGSIQTFDSFVAMTAAYRKSLLLVAITSCVVAAHGQSAGKLKGRVLDNRQRPIIATTIVVFNAQNKFIVSANDDTGEYEIQLPAGTYTVKVEARPGFARFTRRAVVIHAGKTKVLNIFPEARIYAG